MDSHRFESSMPQAEHDSGRLAPARPWLVDGRPDWEAIPFDLTCSRCDYNLRMRAEPNCPECGQTFAWPYVIDAAMRKTQWLFEYHWRQRPFWSWWQTVRRAMNPWRFWQGRSIQEEVRVGPLLCLLMTAQLVTLLLNIGAGKILSAAYFSISAIMSGASGRPPTAGTPAAGFYSAATWLEGISVAWTQLLFLVMYLIQIAAGLLLFLFLLWLILRRHRIRVVQLLRVVAYNAMPLCIFGFLLQFPLRAISPWLSSSQSYWLRTGVTHVAMAALCTLYLSMGLRYYLGVRHAVTVALVGVVITRVAPIGLMHLLDWVSRLPAP